MMSSILLLTWTTDNLIR